MASTFRIAVTTAAAIGVGLGSFGVASAMSTAAQTDPVPSPAEVDEAEVGEVDGIDHQFEGEEVDENGDGIPGPDEATEGEEAAAEEASADEAADVDDVQHESEHEGENDPDEAHED